MVLRTKHRVAIYAALEPLIGEEAAEALLSQFAITEAEEPASKDFVLLQSVELRTEIARLRTEMHAELDVVRKGMYAKDRLGRRRPS